MDFDFKKILLLAGIALFAAIIYLAGPEALLKTLAGANALTLAAAALLVLVVVALNIVKFHILAQSLGKLGLADSARIVSFTQLVNQGMVALVGEAAKGVLLKKFKGVRLSRALSIVAVERFQDVALIFVFSLLVFSRLGVQVPAAAIVLLAAAVVAAIALIAAPERVLRRLLFFPWLRENVFEFREGMRTISPAAFFAAFALSLAAILVGGAANTLILSSLGANVDYATVLTVTSAASLVGLLSALPAGLGAREIVLVGAYSQLGVAPAVAVAASLVLRALFALESLGANVFLSTIPATGASGAKDA